MFTLQDVKEIELERIINYINQKNKKIQSLDDQEQMEKKQAKKITQINMKSLILTLKNNTIDYLKNQFILNDNKITVQKFLYLMKECITYQSSSRYEIFYQLIKLFEEIDIDQSKFMQWAQFLQYLAGYGWLGDSKQRKDKNQKEKYLNWIYRQQNKYRKHNILKIVQVQKLNMLCILQAASFSLTFINFDGSQFTHVPKNQQNNENKQQRQKPQLFTLSSVNLKKVLSIDYCDQQRLFGVLMTDKSLIFIQDGDIQKVVINILGNGQQSQILYLNIHKVWLIRSISGLIQIIQSPKQAKLKQRISFTPHEQPLSSIKQLKNPQCLCTSSLDGTIKLWSINYKQLLISLNPMNEQQTIERMKGIKGIDTLNINSNSYIASWTFTTQIGIWLPSSSVSKPYIGKLKGHIGIVQNCQFSKHKEYLISIDYKKSIRLWNVQKMTCLQMLASEGDTTFIKCLKSHPFALIYSKIMDFYRIKTNTKIDNTHLTRVDFPQQRKKVVTVSFCPYYIYLLLLFNTQLRVFDVNSGKLITIIYPENKQEEQFVCVGLKINRRIFIGSAHGNIYYNNLDTGNLIKKFKVQNFQGSQKYVGVQIKFIYYHGDSKMLLVVAEENNVSIILTYRELISFQFQLTKVLEFQQSNLKKYYFNKKHQVLAIGCQKIITLWDFEKMNIINSISPFGEYINDFNIIEKFNLIVVLTKKKILIYQLEREGFIKEIQIINLPVKIMDTITKFNIQVSNNQGLELNQKQKKVKKVSNKEKSVKFIIQQPNYQNGGQLNQPKKHKLKGSQHILVNKNSKLKQIYIIYLTSVQGVIYAFEATDIIIRKQIKQSLEGKSSIYAGHSIRQFRKCTVKMLKNYRQPNLISDLQDNFLFQKQIFSQKVAQIGSIYREVFYMLGQKGDMSILKTSGQILAILTFGQSQFTYWNLNYNMLPKILQRLNKLQWILNMNQKKNSNEGGQKYKVKFLANLYLNQIDLIEMKEYSKMPTAKSLYSSKQSIFVKKYANGSSKEIKSFSKIKIQQNQVIPKQSQWSSIKKKSRAMSQKMKLNEKKKNIQTKKQNFFNQKYEDKKQQDQKTRIHRKYIQKRIQRTLTYAKNIQKLNKQKPQSQVYSNKKQIQKRVNFIQKLQKALDQMPQHIDFVSKCSLNDLNILNKIDLKVLQKQRQSSIHKLTDNFNQKKQYKPVAQSRQIKRAQSSHNMNRYSQQKNVNSLKSLYNRRNRSKEFYKEIIFTSRNQGKTVLRSNFTLKREKQTSIMNVIFYLLLFIITQFIILIIQFQQFNKSNKGFRMNKKRQSQNNWQNQDSEGECASIQKAFVQQDSIEKIISENLLKRIAIEKAESLITILTIEVERLKKEKTQQNAFYKNQLKKMKQIFDKKQVFLNKTIDSLKAQLKQYQKSQIFEFEKQYYKSNERKQQNMNNNSQYLSRQFTSGKKIKKKIINVDHPNWKSGSKLKNQNQNKNLFDKLSLVFYLQELQLNNKQFQAVQSQYYDQVQILEQLKYNHNQKIFEVQQLFQKDYCLHNKNNYKSKIKAFNQSQKLNHLWIDQIKEPPKTYSQIIKQYAQLLQQYKEYSAYLKAYLCSCLNFINKMSQTYNPTNSANEQIQTFLQDKNEFKFVEKGQNISKQCEESILSTSRTQKYVLNMPDLRISSIIAKKVIDIFKFQLAQANQAIYAIGNQNKQLRSILDQLVQNLKQKQSKKIYAKDYKINQYNNDKANINKDRINNDKHFLNNDKHILKNDEHIINKDKHILNNDKLIQTKYLQRKNKNLYTLTQQNQDYE